MDLELRLSLLLDLFLPVPDEPLHRLGERVRERGERERERGEGRREREKWNEGGQERVEERRREEAREIWD